MKNEDYSIRLSKEAHHRATVHADLSGKSIKHYLDDLIPPLPAVQELLKGKS